VSIRTCCSLTIALVIFAMAMLNAAPAYAASFGHGTTPHVSCSYPGAPDCNMGPPSGGSGGGGVIANVKVDHLEG
jgi:hypothetical protein